MLVYWLLLAGLLLIGIVLDRMKWKWGKAAYCIIAGVALFLVAAVRYDVGHDFFSYGKLFIDFRVTSYADIAGTKLEKGFAIPMKLMTLVFGSNYQMLHVITAFVVALALMIYIYIYSDKPHLSVFCFLTFGIYFNSMNFLRQIIAALIVMYALQYVQKKEFLRYLVLVIFASCFHTSALLMIPFYFILMIPLNWKTLGFFIAVTVPCYIFSREISGVVTEYLYKSYTSGSVEFDKGLNPLYFIFFFVFFIIAFLVRKELVEKNPYNNVLLSCMFFTVFFEFFGTKHAILSRFALLFFIPAVTVLVPQAVEIAIEKACRFFKGRNTAQVAAKVVSYILVFGLCSGMYTYMIANDYNGVNPYRTVYDKEREDAADD